MVGSTPPRYRHKFFFPKYLRPHEGTQGNIRKRCFTSQWATEAERPCCLPPGDAPEPLSCRCSSSCGCPRAEAVPAEPYVCPVLVEQGRISVPKCMPSHPSYPNP